MRTKQFVTAGIAVLALTSVGGAAIAGTTVHGKGATAGSGLTAGTDTDSLEEGDQGTTDTGLGSESDEAGSEATSENGSGDGPGGHEDRPGNVDHQHDGQE